MNDPPSSRGLPSVRHSNNLLASLQAKACARIVDVASTRRGRAWAFQDSKTSRNWKCEGSPSGVVAIGKVDSSRNVLGKGGRSSSKSDGEVLSNAEDTERSDGGAAAIRCFWRAWGLNGL